MHFSLPLRATAIILKKKEQGVSVQVTKLGCLTLVSLAATGCLSASAGSETGAMSGGSLCDESRRWGRIGATHALQVVPQVFEDENGRLYHFDLKGRGGLYYLDARCGVGTYAECAFTATRSTGGRFQFSDISIFGLWETQYAYYLLYSVVTPKSASERRQRRVVQLGDPPVEICNQIGDYSNLM
ncbi:hypothetical protein JH307_18655 [Xanthomonas campestris]|nr:hypothetical protein JH273_14565 [Xanthomonas campestris]WDK31217.1 hypothetical protein JH307_18655 [Xanthomonas campestris]